MFRFHEETLTEDAASTNEIVGADYSDHAKPIV